MSDLEDSTVLVSVTDLKEQKIQNYTEFSQIASRLSHFKVRRPLMNYYHHFIVTKIYNTACGTSVVTVFHYTTSGEILFENATGVGKCVLQTFETGDDIPSSLLDYENGLFHIESESGYPSSEAEANAAFKRMDERLDEHMYHLNWNNCEHVVNYILTGKNASEQFRQSRKLTDCCTLMISDAKQVGLASALLVAALCAISGSLVRRAYVRLILASVISFDAKIGQPIITECPNIIGRNIIEEAGLRISDGTNLPDLSVIPNATHIIKATKDKLNNTYVCEAAEYLAWQAMIKMCVTSLVTSYGIETIIFVCFLYFNVLPMRKTFLRNKAFCRIIFLRLLGGYLSTFFAVGLGTVAQCYLNRPVLVFFSIVFASGLVFRYVLTILAGTIFDTCSCCFCWRCCPMCSGGWKCPSIGIIIFIIVIILAGIGVTLVYYLY